MDNEKRLLAWFLGPKSENAGFLEDSLLLVLRDYFHWRRNYFPSDVILVNRQAQRELEDEYDKMYQNMLEVTAELRRNFPFYSPRYIGHMLSDTLLPATLGYLAGMLYNPNNVTPEAAPVTVDMEIEACNILMEMMEYNPSPKIPKTFTEENIEIYKKELERQFGWGHLTLGGTTANIEALWTARTVKYTALAILDTAVNEGLDIKIKHPSSKREEYDDIKNFTNFEILTIKPNEAIYLLAKYVEAFRRKFDLTIEKASLAASERLKKSPFHINNGVAKLFTEFPPVLFVSGTGHYSIQKAADLLGIGRNNIELIKMDSQFRMDVEDLERKINYVLAKKRIPLAVISIIGTTEEGAVDPLHKIVDLRTEFEEKNISFWIHSDAAWGGYIRALFNLSQEDKLKLILDKTALQLKIQQWSGEVHKWINCFYDLMGKKAHSIIFDDVTHDTNKTISKDDESKRETFSQFENFLNRLNVYKPLLSQAIEHGSYDEFKLIFRKFAYEFKQLGLENIDLEIHLDDREKLVNEFVSAKINMAFGEYSKELELKWGGKEVTSAFLALRKSDSVTIDPHKMGYLNYPCGMIAYKNDRIRHFLLQKAPYITSAKQDLLLHQPPRHIESLGDDPKIMVDAFAPFILEGSRPGAAASSLFLTLKTVPPKMREAGLLVKAALLAARELYNWLVHWDNIMKYNGKDIDYQLIPFTSLPPDTNVVIFGIKKKTSNSLQNMNRLANLVYENFSIQTELGEREYSYSQPFFLSKTTFEEPTYPFESLKPFFNRIFEKDQLEKIYAAYKAEGIIVLRATVMNPYLWMARSLEKQELLRDFMDEFSKTASKAVRHIDL